MIDILGDPVKLLASVFLFVLLCSALFIAMWDTTHGQTVPPEVITVLGAGIGYCLTALGFAHGSNTTSSAASTAVTNLVKAQNESSNPKS